MMKQYEDIKVYAKKCISDEIISCKKHKWACMRFLRDAEKAESDPDYPYYWSEESAQNIVDWFSLLRHSKGTLAREPIILTEWQRFRICQIYGWRRKKDGRRRFKKSFTEVARKNVFNEAGLMLRGSPLREKFDVRRDVITHRKSGSFIKALSKEDGKSGDGTNPANLIIDEYHQHPTTEFYDLGLGSNTKEPLLMIITTAGVDLTSPCYTIEYAYCSKILDPDVDVEDEEYLVDICELDEEDYADLERLDDESLWYKANPIRMTYEEGCEKIRGDYKIAREQPEHMSSFLTKCLNIWVQARENGYMDMAKWKACQVDKLPIDTKGMSVYVGFDMSAKIDLTSVAFIIPFLSGKYDSTGKEIVKYIVFSHSFIPNREKLTERKRKDKVDYDAWERMGCLTVTDTPIVDQNAVMEYVKNTCDKNNWKIECLCFDPANAAKLMMDLSEEGYIVEEVFQSHKSLNESTQGFREQVYSGNIVYTYNPLLNFAMSNAVIRTNQGLIKIDKDATTKRIDPVDAVLCAFKLAMYHEFTPSFLDAIDKYLESDW